MLRTELLEKKLSLPLDFLAEITTIASQHFIAKVEDGKANSDPMFAGIVCRIPHSRFFATKGPKDQTDVNHLFKNTAFHCTPIRYVVALGDRVSQKIPSAAKADFINYFIGDGERSFQGYTVTIQTKAGSSHPGKNEEELSPDIFLESELSIQSGDKTENLTVIGLELKDGHAFDLSDDKDNVRKDALWKIFTLSEENDILIHCKHGHGRTGHLILILELLKHYHTVFGHEDPQVCAERLHEILNRIRTNRPRLVHTQSQFDVLDTVNTLYQYGLEKGFVKLPSRHPHPLTDFPGHLFHHLEPKTEQTRPECEQKVGDKHAFIT